MIFAEGMPLAVFFPQASLWDKIKNLVEHGISTPARTVLKKTQVFLLLDSKN